MIRDKVQISGNKVKKCQIAARNKCAEKDKETDAVVPV
jgi:hypothetical protein